MLRYWKLLLTAVAVFICPWFVVAAKATPNTVDVSVKMRMSQTARYPTAVGKLIVRNNSSGNFKAVGHMVAVANGTPVSATIITFPFRFDGAKPDLYWHMPLGAYQTRTLKFTARATAKRRYCLKVWIDVTYVNSPKGGSAYGRGCVNVRP